MEMRGELRAYYDRQIVSDGEDYLRRYSFLQTDGQYIYDDYLVESTERINTAKETASQSAWFIGP